MMTGEIAKYLKINEVNNLINRIATYTEMLLSFKPLELKCWLTEEDLQKIIKED